MSSGADDEHIEMQGTGVLAVPYKVLSIKFSK